MHWKIIIIHLLMGIYSEASRCIQYVSALKQIGNRSIANLPHPASRSRRDQRKAASDWFSAGSREKE